MVRLFHVYYPVRTLILLVGEALVVCLSFLAAAWIEFGSDSYLVLITKAACTRSWPPRRWW